MFHLHQEKLARPQRKRSKPARYDEDEIVEETQRQQEEDEIEEEEEPALDEVPEEEPERPRLPEKAKKPKSGRKKKTDQERHDRSVAKLKERGFSTVPLEMKAEDGSEVKKYHPVTVVGGPKHRAPNATPLEMFRRFFTDEVINHVVEQTNTWMKGNPKKVGGRLAVLDQPTLLNFVALLFASTLVDYREWELAWKDRAAGLFGNAFFQDTMPYTHFRAIYRGLNADVERVTRWLNEASQREWTLGGDVDFDDDLDHFSGRGKTKYVPKKEAKNGIASWRGVDNLLYCYHLVWEDKVAVTAGPVSLEVLEQLLTPLLPLASRNIYIDAGLLGGWEVVERLLKTKHHFLISHATNRPGWLFGNMLHIPVFKLKKHTWRTLSSPRVTAIAFGAAKKAGPMKKVNFTTDMPGLGDPDPSDAQRPRAVPVYNAHKGYVDSLKSIFNTYALSHRTLRLWKHQFIVVLFLKLHNAYRLWYHSAVDDDERKKRPLISFIEQLALGLRSVRPLPHPLGTAEWATALWHEYQQFGERGRCRICSARVKVGCAVCQVYLCVAKDCFRLFHFRRLPELRALVKPK